MIFNININLILDAVYAVINGDSTLQGNSYLESANKVFLNIVSREASAPYGVITCGELKPNAMQMYTGEIRIFVYTKLLSNSMIDPKGNLILSRCEELLNNKCLSINGMTTQPLYSLGIIPSFLDIETDHEKARGVLRLRIEVANNP